MSNINRDIDWNRIPNISSKIFTPDNINKIPIYTFYNIVTYVQREKIEKKCQNSTEIRTRISFTFIPISIIYKSFLWERHLKKKRRREKYITPWRFERGFKLLSYLWKFSTWVSSEKVIFKTKTRNQIFHGDLNEDLIQFCIYVHFIWEFPVIKLFLRRKRKKYKTPRRFELGFN